MDLKTFKRLHLAEYRALPKKVGKTPSYIQMIMDGVRTPRPEVALDIYLETGGKVSLDTLRPNLAKQLKRLTEMGLLPLR